MGPVGCMVVIFQRYFRSLIIPVVMLAGGCSFYPVAGPNSIEIRSHENQGGDRLPYALVKLTPQRGRCPRPGCAADRGGVPGSPGARRNPLWHRRRRRRHDLRSPGRRSVHSGRSQRPARQLYQHCRIRPSTITATSTFPMPATFGAKGRTPARGLAGDRRGVEEPRDRTAGGGLPG